MSRGRYNFGSYPEVNRALLAMGNRSADSAQDLFFMLLLELLRTDGLLDSYVDRVESIFYVPDDPDEVAPDPLLPVSPIVPPTLSSSPRPEEYSYNLRSVSPATRSLLEWLYLTGVASEGSSRAS